MVTDAPSPDTGRVGYDIDLADRLREILAGEPDLVEKRMFGGLAFLVAGHLAVDIDALATDADLNRWVEQGLGYVRSLPLT